MAFLRFPRLMIGSAVVLYMGVAIVTPQTGKSMGEVILELLADWTKIFIGRGCALAGGCSRDRSLYHARSFAISVMEVKIENPQQCLDPAGSCVGRPKN